MSAELLTQSYEDSENLAGAQASIGKTVFEALAVSAEGAIKAPEGVENTRFTSSLTRIPGGQTVPDER